MVEGTGFPIPEVDRLAIDVFLLNTLRRSGVMSIADLKSLVMSSPNWRFRIRNLGATGAATILRALIIDCAQNRDKRETVEASK